MCSHLPIVPPTPKNINQSAFSNTQIRGDLILPSNLRNIGAFAFSNTTNLIGKLYISNSLSTIGYAAFFESSISSIEFEDNSKLVLISDLAFGMCEKISGEVNIPGSVKYIGTYAFEVCSSIDKIVLNEGLLWIGDFAFEHIPNLSNTSINIPSTVKQIGGKNYTGEVTSHGVNPFYDTGKSLTNFIVADGNTNYKVIDGVLYSKDGTVLVSYPNKKVSSSYEMLDTCTTTFATAFSRNQNLKNLTLSDSFVVEDSTSWYTHDSSYINDTNNLSASLYKYSALENISVKSTNTKYKSENGLLLSNDGKILYYVPRYNSNGQILLLPNVETIFKGAIVKQNSEATGISIPATVKDIQGTGITDINSIFSGNIIINESNSVYTIDSSGKLIIK